EEHSACGEHVRRAPARTTFWRRFGLRNEWEKTAPRSLSGYLSCSLPPVGGALALRGTAAPGHCLGKGHFPGRFSLQSCSTAVACGKSPTRDPATAVTSRPLVTSSGCSACLSLTRTRPRGANMPSPELSEFLSVLRSGDQQAIQNLLRQLDPFLRSVIHLRLI